MADGSITFETKLDNKQLERDLKQAKKKISSLETQESNIKSKQLPLIKEAEKLSVRLSAARTELEKLKAEQATVQATLNPYSGQQVTPDQYMAASARQNELNAQIAAQEKNLKAIRAEWDSVLTKIGKYDEQLEITSASIESAKDQAGRLRRELVKVNFSNKLKSTASGVVNAMKKMVGYAGKLAKSGLDSMFGNKSGGSMLKNMKRMVMYSMGMEGLYSLFSKIRRAIFDGIESLAKFSSSANDSISQFKSALTGLKNSLAAAFLPIFTAIQPALTSFISMITRAVEAIGRLFAMLSGSKTFIRAKKVQENYADSLGGTSAAAKEAQKSLAGFDEITKLQGKSDSGGGGGSSSADLFEEVPIEPFEFDSWGEAFSAMLDSLINDGIPKLEQAFTKFANWLNWFTGNVYEMFTFPGVDEKVILLGAELANAFNGLVNQINWETLGGAIGAGLDLALKFLVSTIWNFDWINLGSQLATAFNSFVDEIDWYALGQLLWAKFKIAIETLAGFLQNLDMNAFGKAASNFVIGFWDSVSETINNVDWELLGNQITELIFGIDWAGMIGAVMYGLHSILVGALDLLWGTVEKYFDDWGKWAEEQGMNWVAGIAFGIFGGIGELVITIVDLCVGAWEAFTGYFGIHSPSTVMEEGGGYLVDGLLNGLKNGWTAITGFIGEKCEDMQTAFSETWDAIKETAGEIWDSITETIKGAINGIIGVINGMISGVVRGINSVGRALNALKIDVPSWVPGIGGKSLSMNIPTITAPQIPYLAKGAVIPPNREFMAVLGDQKHGTNIEAPLETIQEAVAVVMGDQLAAMMAGFEAVVQAINDKNMVTYIGDREVGEAAARYNRRQGLRSGNA